MRQIKRNKQNEKNKFYEIKTTDDEKNNVPF